MKERSSAILFFLQLLLLLILTDSSTCKDVATGVSEKLYCEGCIATVKELMKLLNKRTSDPKDLVITEALENVCKPYNFVEYQYSPPKTVKACQLLLERHEEEIESLLAKNIKDIESHICYDMSKACLNVDRSEKPETPDGVDVSINGDTKRSEIVYEMDPKTGEAKRSKEQVKKEPKTLSKKDRKPKASKKEKKRNKNVDEKKKDPVDFFQLDVNDPDSVNKVLAQIKEATEDHSKEFYRKKEEEETRKEEEEEKENLGSKDEL